MLYNYQGNQIADITAGRNKSRTLAAPNRLNPSAFSVGWVNTTAGGDDTLNTSNANTRTTAAIPVSYGQVVSMGYIKSYNHNPFFVCTDKSESCLAYAFFNASHQVVSGETSRPGVIGGISVPSGAAYVRVTFFDGDPVNHPEKFYVYVESANVTDVTPWFANNTETLTPDDSQLWNLWGKKWTLFGDSLTDSYGGHGWDKSTSSVGGAGWKDAQSSVSWTDYFWASAIARQFGLALDNRAKAGSNINQGNNGNYADVCGVNMLDAFLTEIDNGATPPDYITVGFGTNNIGSQLGASTDTASTKTTTYGAAKYFIEQIRDKCPYAALGFVLPPPGDWTGISTVKDIDTARTALQAVCEAYKVPYIDMNSGANITLDMLPDKIHVSSIEANGAYMRAMRKFVSGI